jgi:uncharacterized protein (TIGR03118 family)
MKTHGSLTLRALWLRTCAVLSAYALLVWPAVSFGQQYHQTNLVAGGHTTGVPAGVPNDSDLVNPWGLARSTTSPWWVADNGTGKSTLYNGQGNKQGLVVTVPGSPPPSTGTPTGVVFNGSQGFALPSVGPAHFIFVSEDGSISGWNSDGSAVTVVPGSNASVFKGVTIAQRDGAQFLYVADFRQGNIKVYNTSFKRVFFSPLAFFDFFLPRGYAPFNVANIGGNLYVAFAKQDQAKHDEVDGAGFGFVDVFTPEGFLLQRLQHGDWFNAPWGLVLAPSDFGSASHKLLVGQFGSGEILVFNPVSGKFEGKLLDDNNHTIQIEGLWGISFGSGIASGTDDKGNPLLGTSGPANTLFFNAGVNGENGGLFGTLTPVSADLTQGNGQ